MRLAVQQIPHLAQPEFSDEEDRAVEATSHVVDLCWDGRRRMPRTLAVMVVTAEAPEALMPRLIACGMNASAELQRSMQEFRRGRHAAPSLRPLDASDFVDDLLRIAAAFMWRTTGASEAEVLEYLLERGEGGPLSEFLWAFPPEHVDAAFRMPHVVVGLEFWWVKSLVQNLPHSAWGAERGARLMFMRLACTCSDSVAQHTPETMNAVAEPILGLLQHFQVPRVAPTATWVRQLLSHALRNAPEHAEAWLVRLLSLTTLFKRGPTRFADSRELLPLLYGNCATILQEVSYNRHTSAQMAVAQAVARAVFQCDNERLRFAFRREAHERWHGFGDDRFVWQETGRELEHLYQARERRQYEEAAAAGRRRAAQSQPAPRAGDEFAPQAQAQAYEVPASQAETEVDDEEPPPFSFTQEY